MLTAEVLRENTRGRGKGYRETQRGGVVGGNLKIFVQLHRRLHGGVSYYTGPSWRPLLPHSAFMPITWALFTPQGLGLRAGLLLRSNFISLAVHIIIIFKSGQYQIPV